jgi:WD40 repeat protein
MVGRQLGPYTILAPLGAGGMGEVYRARDPKLGRDVAIKILPSHFTTDPERRARFAREARTLATLNHPHIGAIYGLEQSDGVDALVLELVEGQTLADRLARGPLKRADAIVIARQIAEALDTAHEKGIVHRDLKPANIVLQGTRDDVRVKVLDFGLAKFVRRDEERAADATATMPSTEDGRILGTPAYMSPEQARGEAVDKRADIWAFGCVLFEMLSGRQAFDGKTITDTLAHVLEREPDWSLLPTETPEAIRILLQRSLRKDPHKRLHDVADARIELDDDRELAPAPSRRGSQPFLWITTGLLIGAALAAGGFGLWRSHPAAALAESLELELGPPPGSRFVDIPSFAIAPDGTRVVMVATAGNSSMLWVRRMGSAAEYDQVRGTEGAVNPFWSPDSRRIGFFADGKLKTVGLGGEAPFAVCDAVSRYWANGGGAWNDADVILFRSADGALLRVAANGGTPTPVTTLTAGERAHSWPSFLPDGQHFLFVATGDRPHQLHIGSLTSESKPIGAIRSNAVYAAGHLIFVQGRLMAQRFDVRRHELEGEPFPLLDRPSLWSPTAAVLLGSFGGFSVSGTGLVAMPQLWLKEVQLTWLDRTGKPMGSVGARGSYFNIGLSPDDRRVAASSRGADRNIDIVVFDMARGGDNIRVTSHQFGEHDPTWSPDGNTLAFTSNKLGAIRLFRQPSDGGGSDEVAADVGRNGVFAPDWSPDGKSIIFHTETTGLWVQPLGVNEKPWVFASTGFNESNPAFSPDGRWVAYSSTRTGSSEIYVRPFPAKDPEHKVSRTGGQLPRWRRNEIFFVDPGGVLMAARFDGSQSPPAMIPLPLFPTGLTSELHNHPYDVSHDGKRILIPLPVDPFERSSITIITNWTARQPR